MEVLGLTDELGCRQMPNEWAAVDMSGDFRHRLASQSHSASVREDEPVLRRPSEKSRNGSTSGEGDTCEQETVPRREHIRKKKSGFLRKAKARKWEGQRTDVEWLAPERHEGSVEYKLRVAPRPQRVPNLLTQMQYRLTEGNGECAYVIGVEDNGYPRGLSNEDLDSSLKTLRDLAGRLNAELVSVATRAGVDGYWAEAHIKLKGKSIPSGHDLHVVVAGSVIGDTNSGKSTLVSVITRGNLDDGHGSARLEVLRHKHEVESGHTSSLSHQAVGYGSEGEVLHHAALASSASSKAADRVVTFVDLGGHRKCLKTALFGMTCMAPDYALLTVAAPNGVGAMTREHLAALLAMRVPTFAVLTQTDLCTGSLRETAFHVQELLASAAKDAGLCQDRPPEAPVEAYAPLVTSRKQAAKLGARFAKRCTEPAGGLSSPTNLPGWVPIIPTSSASGYGIDSLHAFLWQLRPSSSYRASSEPVRFQVEDSYVPSESDCVVVAGTVISGMLKSDQQLLLGPRPEGDFDSVRVQSIRRSGTQSVVSSVPAGTACTLSLILVDSTSGQKSSACEASSGESTPWMEMSPELVDVGVEESLKGKLRPDMDPPDADASPTRSATLDFGMNNRLDPIAHSPVLGRKGAVLLDYEMRPNVVSCFSASLAIAKDRWQDMTEKVIHCGSVRQSAFPLCVQDMHVCSELSDCEPAAAAVVSDEPPPSALVWFRFKHLPEWLETGARVIVRNTIDGMTAAVGVIHDVESES